MRIEREACRKWRVIWGVLAWSDIVFVGGCGACPEEGSRWEGGGGVLHGGAGLLD